MAWVKPRKRKNGSVYFCVYFRELNHQTGKKAQTSLSWDNFEDADQCRQLIDQLGPEKAREILRIVQTPGSVQTVRQFLLKHIDHLTGVEQGTLARYRAYVRNDVGPALGEIPLTALSRDDVSRWIAKMTADGASGKTVANKHGFLAGALNVGVRAGELKSNPCEGMRLPRWDREDMTFLEAAEFHLLLSSVTEYWRPLVQFLVASGARWSEATALKPGDIDRRGGTVRIRRAWKTGAGGYQLGVPKTKKSVRTINVPTDVLAQLDYSGEWVFTNSGRNSTGDPNGPARIHSFNPNVWVPAVKRAQAAGLTKRPRVHDLRHTCASWLIQSGRPLPAIQAQLGHESIQTTVGVYGHLDRSSGRDNADVIGAMLRPPPSPKDSEED
jgi:integrase